MSRENNLMPNGIPRYVRCYDNRNQPGETLDCFTVVLTRLGRRHGYPYLAIGRNPATFSQRGWGWTNTIDQPTYGHLGKKVAFTDLPKAVQTFVRNEYRDYWNLNK